MSWKRGWMSTISSEFSMERSSLTISESSESKISLGFSYTFGTLISLIVESYFDG